MSYKKFFKSNNTMFIISYFKEIVKYVQVKSLQIYLILVNLLLIIFGIWFFNVSFLPFKSLSDFAVFAGFGLLFAIYRSGWAFLFFIGTIALENINLAPEILGVAVRPYQLLAILIISATLIKSAQKKNIVDFPKLYWPDWVILSFGFAGFLSVFTALEKGLALKQSIIALSFIGIYFLVRTFIDNFSDIKKIFPFFLSSAVLISFYGIWQNIRFAKGLESFEVMPGRPNATFTEADWLGEFLIMFLAVICAAIYYFSKKNDALIIDSQILEKAKKINFFRFANKQIIAYFAILTFIFVVLIMTVARSAWLGAIVVLVFFVKAIFLNSSLRSVNWQFKKASYMTLGIVTSFVLAIGFVKVFNLSSFELVNRAQSTASGLQEITISCESENINLPDKIQNIDDLLMYGCKHINLEEIESEKERGEFVTTINRADPNIKIRSEIYAKSLNEIRKNPIFGIGWGSIGKVLGVDDRGSSLNASNIFLEVWLGSGILGLVSLIFIFGFILIKSLIMFFKEDEDKRVLAVFLILGFFATVIPNLFNSGIFLAFLWVYFGIAISLLKSKK